MVTKKRLKCWKKVISEERGTTFKSKDGKYVHVFSSYPVVPLGMGDKYPPVWKFRSDDERETFFDKPESIGKAKKEALKRANKYMKKHGVC